jgi:hypothetical protein
MLSNIYSYILSFHKNLWDLNDYYSNRYAAISSIEYWLTKEYGERRSLSWNILNIDDNDIIISGERWNSINWISELIWKYKKELSLNLY